MTLEKTAYHVSKEEDKNGSRKWKVFIQCSTKVLKNLCKNKDDGSYVLFNCLDGKIRKY